MILRKCALTICLFTSLVAGLHSQDKPQPKKQGMPEHFDVCPPKSRCVDLWALAHQLDQPDINDAATMVLEAPKGRPHRIHAHDEILLSYTKQEQIIWTYSNGKGFQITQIHKVIRNECDKSGPDMPFDLTVHTNLLAPQKPGTPLASGAPIKGTAGHWYKFSFIIAHDTPPAYRKNAPPAYDQGDPPTLIVGKLYDPHIIVTGGDPSGREMACPSPTPRPSPSPHKKEKSNSQEGGKPNND